MSGFSHIREGGKRREANLEFLKKMHLRGAHLEKPDLVLLRDHGVLTTEEIRDVLDQADDPSVAEAALDRYILTPELYEARCIAAGFTEKWKDKEIEKEDWKCEKRGVFDSDFVSFINSHFGRFCDLEAYEPMWLYKQQGDRWLAEEDPDFTTMDRYQTVAWRAEEVRRIKTNTYFAVEKYGWYKEASLPDGEGKFKSNMAHIFLMYLIDDGRSGYVGKGRQMASTTLLMLIAAFKVNNYRNFHCKLIACDLKTTEEIFEDKLKYGFSRFPRWHKRKVINDNDGLFRVTYSPDGDKGTRKGLSSKLSIVAPRQDAINGGAPDIIFVDEAVFLQYFNMMVKEGRPTIYTTGPTGRLEITRQLWCWGTGGRSAKGGGSFEIEHRGLFNKWHSGEYADGIIPIFLDWTCRPNVTAELFLNEQKAYRSGQEDGESERSLAERDTLFRQHWPSSLDDMYSVSGNTLVDASIIQENDRKITALPLKMRPVRGHFEPIFDTRIIFPPGSTLPHPPKDAVWVPEGEHALSAPCTMFMPPTPTWKDRNYQYTDPVLTDEGYSNHASAIWDSYYNTVPCIVNMRTDDPYDSYIQAQLMGIAYRNHGQQYTPHLIENNIGKALIKYLQGHEWQAGQSLVTNFQLPDYLQGGGETIGIDTHAGRKQQVVHLGKSMILTHGGNIYQPDFWRQMKYFTGKSSANGKSTLWGVENRKMNKDDVVDAVFGAYTCRLCFPHRMPVEMDSEQELGKKRAPVNKLIWDNRTHTNRWVKVSSRPTPVQQIEG